MTDAILDGAEIVRATFGGRGGDLRDYLRMCYPQADLPPMSAVVATAAPLTARVNHGRWIASCDCGMPGLPRPGCLVDLSEPLAWCVRCGNQAVGRGWRPVTIPPESLRRKIEAVLLCRPRPEHRNWEPTESVADLLAQNVEHGDPVPDLAALASGPLHGPDWREFVTPFSPLVKQARRRFSGLGRLLRR